MTEDRTRQNTVRRHTENIERNAYGRLKNSDGVQRTTVYGAAGYRTNNIDETAQRADGNRPKNADGTVRRADGNRPKNPDGTARRSTGDRPKNPDGTVRKSAGDRPKNPDGTPRRRKRKLSPEEIALRKKKRRIKKIKKATAGFGFVSVCLAVLVGIIMLLSAGLSKAMSGLMVEETAQSGETKKSFKESVAEIPEPVTEAATEAATEYPTFEEPESYSADAMREKGVPEVLIEFYQKYPEVAPYAWFYPEKSKIDYDMDISKDVKPGEIPYFCQWDDRWGYKEFGNSYFGVAGCGPTCISMVYSGLTGKSDKNPYQIGLELAEREYYIPGSGTIWEAMNDIPAEYGLTVLDVPCYEEDIISTLQEGHPIICNVIPGDFTLVGHYIILTGVDSEGMLSIYDPNSPERTAKKWDIKQVIVQIDALWGYAYYSE